MIEALRRELLALAGKDAEVRSALADDGSLFDGYHPVMEAVHRANASRLREIIDAYGWPTAALAGDDGAEAAWVIAQHSIGEPAFMVVPGPGPPQWKRIATIHPVTGKRQLRDRITTDNSGSQRMKSPAHSCVSLEPYPWVSGVSVLMRIAVAGQPWSRAVLSSSSRDSGMGTS